MPPMPYTILTGQIQRTGMPDLGVGDGHLTAVPSEVVGTFVLYREDEDQIYEIVVRGLMVQLTQWEPTFEQRLSVAAHQMAELMREEGFDVHDFKAIVLAALLGLEHDEQTSGEKADLLERLDNIFHKLGGLD